MANDKLLVFDPKEEDDNFFYHGVKQNNRDFTKKAHKDAHFAFDAVFAPESTNEEVFEGTTKAVVDAVLEGFNCSGIVDTPFNKKEHMYCIFSNLTYSFCFCFY